MAIGDVVTIGGQDLTEAGFLARDCAFPMTRFVQRVGSDDVLSNMPVAFGYWADDTFAPFLLDQNINVDTSVVSDECEAAVVTGDLTEGGLIAPNMRKIKLRTNTLVIDKLVPPFCRQRNIDPASEMGRILNSDGTIKVGHPYAEDFGRYAMAQVNAALAEIVGTKALKGDFSDTDDFGIDGLYTQLEGGWQQATVGIPDYLNHAIIFDWETLTGDSPATPDSITTAGHTIALWGQDFAIPEGINLITLFDDFIFPAIESTWTNNNGGVGNYEMHVPKGSKRNYQRASSCMGPCGDMTGIWDIGLRDRYASVTKTNVLEFYPSGRIVPIWETDKIEPNTLWIGPRTVGGDPTYSLIFRDLDVMFGQDYPLTDTYGQGDGIFPVTEELLEFPIDQLPFEARAVHYDVTKVSMDCVQGALMTIVGMLVVMRHLWIKVENVSGNGFVSDVTNSITIDGVPIDGRPAKAVQNTPAANATGFSVTGNLVVTAVTGADSYDFQVATDSNFTDVIRAVNQAGVTYAVTPALTAATIYYWRVRARNEHGAGKWSVARKLTTA